MPTWFHIIALTEKFVSSIPEALKLIESCLAKQAFSTFFNQFSCPRTHEELRNIGQPKIAVFNNEVQQ